MSEPPVVRPPARPPVAAPLERTAPRRKLGDLIHQRWVMLAVLFGATAALGLPWLWKSRAFSRNEKIFWSAVVSLYTLLIFWIFFQVMWWSYSRIVESLP